MARRILLLNLFLLAMIAIGAYELVQSWKGYEQERNLTQILEQAQSQIGRNPISGEPQISQEVPIHDFFVIGERDLFSPDRQPVAAEDAEANAPEAPKFPKRPEMRGVSESGGIKRALVTVFDTPKSPGDSRSYAVGDFLQGWAVSDIANTTVTLKWNDQTEVIDMFDSDSTGRPAPRGGGRKVAAVNVVRIGSQYAAVETTGSDETGLEQGDRGGHQTPGASSRALRSRPGTSQRGTLVPRRSSTGSRNAGSTPLGATGVVGFPSSAPQSNPNPQ